MIHHDTMIYSHTGKETIQRNTRILYRNKRNQEYIMTNQNGSTQELLRIFAATIDGTITMEGPLLGSLFAHDPYIIPDLEKVECTFEELNASYFNRDPIVDGLIGQAVGDAFGVPVEFMSRDKVRELSLHDMVGNDCPIHFTSRWSTLIPSGAWSDDTSMTIAAMASIINHQGEIDYDDIMELIGRYVGTPSMQKMTKEQLVNLICSSANLIDEREDIIDYIDDLDTKGVNGKTEKEIEQGYELFKKDKFTKAISSIAEKHHLDIEAVQTFVNEIVERRIFDGEKLYDLIAPLELGWKDRARKEEELMKDLIPLLKRMAGGQKISGLSAYEE